MNFITLFNAVSDSVFPEGRAENLIARHRNIVVDSLIELQHKVPSLRSLQSDVIDQGDTFYKCGASVMDAVPGQITRVYSVEAGKECAKTEYSFVQHQRIRDLMEEFVVCGGDDTAGALPGSGSPSNPLDLPPGDPAQDRGDRATCGHYSIHQGALYVFPSLESSDSLIVDWSGVRRSWADTTPIPPPLREREVIRAVELYLEAETHRTETKDLHSYQSAIADYREAVASLIYDARNRTRPPVV
jgi:hypothetical protein